MKTRRTRSTSSSRFRKAAPVKYEVDKLSGAMFVDRFLHTAMFYPANYGFIPHTMSEDGDPLDCW